jgi:mRNA-degrading endonuclease RelE of RelBE toxin-antitoxin system
LRKVRWQGSGRGKRGGIRVIDYWIVDRDSILMLLAYPKSEQDDLTAAQKRSLRRVVEDELR